MTPLTRRCRSTEGVSIQSCDSYFTLVIVFSGDYRVAVQKIYGPDYARILPQVPTSIGSKAIMPLRDYLWNWSSLLPK